MLKKEIIILITGLLMFAASPVSFAGIDEPVGKLTAGVTNVLTGWAEVPLKMKETYEEDKSIVAGFIIGTAKGAIYAVGRTVAGLLDMISFFMPPYEQPLMEPIWPTVKEQFSLK